jgi:hypothetical protein
MSWADRPARDICIDLAEALGYRVQPLSDKPGAPWCKCSHDDVASDMYNTEKEAWDTLLEDLGLAVEDVFETPRVQELCGAMGWFFEELHNPIGARIRRGEDALDSQESFVEERELPQHAHVRAFMDALHRDRQIHDVHYLTQPPAKGSKQ